MVCQTLPRVHQVEKAARRGFCVRVGAGFEPSNQGRGWGAAPTGWLGGGPCFAGQPSAEDRGGSVLVAGDRYHSPEQVLALRQPYSVLRSSVCNFSHYKPQAECNTVVSWH